MSKKTNKKSALLFVFLFLGWIPFHALSIDEHSKTADPRNPKRKGEERVELGESCLGGRALAAFANGEEYDMEGMVSFLSDSSCDERRADIARSAMSYRISFNDVPFRLKQAASNYNPSSFQSLEQTSQTLLRTVPIVLKEHPSSNEELLPILGQVAVLSQPAARKVLAEMIQKELVSGDGLMRSNPKGKSGFAAELAKTLLTYGANNPVIASELAESTEEMALSSQVDSLGKILNALAEAARAESGLVSTFQLTVGATRRGVEKGTVFFSVDDSRSLLKMVFERLKAQFLAESPFESASEDYNRAMKVLLQDKSLNKTVLREAWRESLKILAYNRSQSALAKAVALSLSGDSVYLGDDDKRLLLAAANNYASIAVGVQRSFLSAWNEAWEGVQDRTVPPSLFNNRKDRYLVPTVEGVLELEPGFIETEWVKFVWEKGFIKDEQIESRFPKMVLFQIKRREKALKQLATSASFQSSLESLAETMAVSRALSSVQIPALNVWIKKNETTQSESSEQ